MTHFGKSLGTEMGTGSKPQKTANRKGSPLPGSDSGMARSVQFHYQFPKQEVQSLFVYGASAFTEGVALHRQF
jgi:hypothetical protein